MVTAYVGGFEEARLSYASGQTRTIQRLQASQTVRRNRALDVNGDLLAQPWFFLHRDHLGSVDAVSDTAGALINTLHTSFDAFGALRDGTTWGSDLTSADEATLLDKEQNQYSRGFTDHEMLHRTGFVHMNGRV